MLFLAKAAKKLHSVLAREKELHSVPARESGTVCTGSKPITAEKTFSGETFACTNVLSQTIRTSASFLATSANAPIKEQLISNGKKTPVCMITLLKTYLTRSISVAI